MELVHTLERKQSLGLAERWKETLRGRRERVVGRGKCEDVWVTEAAAGDVTENEEDAILHFFFFFLSGVDRV